MIILLSTFYLNVLYRTFIRALHICLAEPKNANLYDINSVYTTRSLTHKTMAKCLTCLTLHMSRKIAKTTTSNFSAKLPNNSIRGLIGALCIVCVCVVVCKMAHKTMSLLFFTVNLMSCWLMIDCRFGEYLIRNGPTFFSLNFHHHFFSGLYHRHRGNVVDVMI